MGCAVNRVASQPALAQAIANGKPRLQVLIVGKTGTIETIAGGVAATGGRVLVRFDDVDYLRAEVPLTAYFTLCTLPEVMTLIPNYERQMRSFRSPSPPTRRPDPSAPLKNAVEKLKAAAAKKQQPATPALAAEMLTAGNPYLPIHQVGALRLRQLEPRADGRGVTIANMEGLFDPAHPTMRGALDLEARPIGKIAGVIDTLAIEDTIGSDPEQVSGAQQPDGSLIRVEATVDVTAPGEPTTVGGRTYFPPAAGRFFVGRYQQKDGATIRAVFWTAAREVWIDTNDDGDLRDERRLREIGTTRDEDPAYTTLRPTADAPDLSPKNPTVLVQFDSLDRPHVYAPNSSHSTMVSSTAAGSHFLGGSAGSVAPAARLMLVNLADLSLGQYVESYVLAARDPRVDVMTSSTGIQTMPDGAGESVTDIVFDRLARRYGKAMFVAASNQGMLAHPSIESSSAQVLSVGAYYGGDTVRALYGWQTPGQDNLANYSSAGPAITGAFKPDFVAPTMSLAADNCEEPKRLATATLPECYQVGGGTSNATPFAAGSAAALLSAARLNHLPHDAQYLSWALRAGARPLAGYSIGDVGAGLIQIDRSFELLQRAPRLPELTVSAPVERVDAAYLTTPGRGPGLMLHDGWYVGRSETRAVEFSLAAATPVRTYTLRWRDNDGTFSSPGLGRTTLRSGDRVHLPIRVAPKSPGLHAAAIELIDASAGMPVNHVAVAVVAAQRAHAANGYTVEQRLTAPWPRSVSGFFEVPDPAFALRMQLSGGAGKVCHATMLSPIAGIDASPNPAWHYWQTFVAGESRSTYVTHAAAGVWQFRIEPCGPTPKWNGVEDREIDHVPLEATARWTLYGASATVAPAPAGANGGEMAVVTFRNRGAVLVRPAVTVAAGRIVSSGSGRFDPRKSAGAILFDFTVEPGATNLHVSMNLEEETRKSRAAGAPLVDLYLYRCDKQNCLIADLRPGAEWVKTIRVPDPLPGAWKVLMVPAQLAGKAVRYRYSSVVTAPRYGILQARLASSGPLALGASRSATLTLPAAHFGGKPDGDRVAIVSLIDLAHEDSPEQRHVNTGRFDWPPLPLATAVIPLHPDVAVPSSATTCPKSTIRSK